MFRRLKRAITKIFREFLLYHHSFLEYRAKILTLMVSSNGEICECEKQKLKEIAYIIYADNHDRAEILMGLHECMKTEEDILFQRRIIEFLQNLKDEYAMV